MARNSGTAARTAFLVVYDGIRPVHDGSAEVELPIAREASAWIAGPLPRGVIGGLGNGQDVPNPIQLLVILI